MGADQSLRRAQPISLLKTASQKIRFGSAVFLVFSGQEQGSIPGSGGCPHLLLHPLFMKGRCNYFASCLISLLEIKSGARKSWVTAGLANT